MLPAFIFALARARLRDLEGLRTALALLVGEREREGEQGYYLATLEAAVSPKEGCCLGQVGEGEREGAWGGEQWRSGFSGFSSGGNL